MFFLQWHHNMKKLKVKRDESIKKTHF